MTISFQEFSIVMSCAVLAGFLGNPLPKYLMDTYRNRLYSKDFPKDGIKEEMCEKKYHEKTKSITRTLGILERIIYAGGWLMGYPEIIGILLAVKVSPSLRATDTENKVVSWAIFNMYLIGNFVSLICAIVIAQLSKFGIDWIIAKI